VAACAQDAIDGLTLRSRDAVLVFTHDPKLDVPVVQAALSTQAGYIGALGSRRTTVDRNARLVQAGVSEEELELLYAPCGLDIGSSTVEETAVAILAEIIAEGVGREGSSLRGGSGPIGREHEQSGELLARRASADEVPAG
jgi:xanthine dehydrogenase accessory factor